MIRLTRTQVREVDRLCVERYHIPGIVLMENAARAVFDEVQLVAGSMRADSVVIFCGPGNNGGDGLAVARHAHNFGMPVSIILAVDPQSYRGDARSNWEIVREMKIPIADAPPDSREAQIFIDALFGTGLSKPPAGKALELIEFINSQSHAYAIAVDLPSGLDCDTGEPMGACVKAKNTVTFVAEKAGFANPRSTIYTGKVIVGDIGAPRELIQELSLT